MSLLCAMNEPHNKRNTFSSCSVYLVTPLIVNVFAVVTVMVGMQREVTGKKQSGTEELYQKLGLRKFVNKSVINSGADQREECVEEDEVEVICDGNYSLTIIIILFTFIFYL